VPEATGWPTRHNDEGRVAPQPDDRAPRHPITGGSPGLSPAVDTIRDPRRWWTRHGVRWCRLSSGVASGTVYKRGPTPPVKPAAEIHATSITGPAKDLLLTDLRKQQPAPELPVTEACQFQLSELDQAHKRPAYVARVRFVGCPAPAGRRSFPQYRFRRC
jgi:hypothetical protein